MQEKISKDREEIEIIIKTIEGILQKDIKDTDENVYTIDGKQYKAIKNILKENENLKQAILINKKEYQDVCNKNKELAGRNKRQQEENKKLNTKIINQKGQLKVLYAQQKELTDKEKEIVEAYRNLVKLTGKTGNWIVCDPTQMWSEHFIQKSLVKELQEETENNVKRMTPYKDVSPHDYGYVCGQNEILQRLLGEE